MLSAAAHSFAAAAIAILASALIAPISASAQRHNGSVSVDMTVLDQLGRPATVPQLLQPGVRSLMMPNVRRPATSRFAAPALSQPRGNAAAAPGRVTLKPPSQMKRAAPARRAAAKAAPRPLTRQPVVERPRPPAPPKIAARPTVSTTAPRAPAVPAPPRAVQPVPPPPAPAMTPPPAAPAVTPPPPPPVAKSVTVPPVPAPRQTASLPPSSSPRGSLAAGQQFRLTFGAGAATVENAAGTQLDNVAKALKGNEALRLQLLAYSGGGTQTPSQARRFSLSRALAVRSHLIKQGVRSTRIDVRALGNKSEGGPPDRVDVIVTAR